MSETNLNEVVAAPNQITFESLQLPEALVRAVKNEGYEIPTPIQAQCIPLILEGRDMVGCAQTGTGKTAAFSLPSLARLSAKNINLKDRRRPIRMLVLCPTRELALQIGESLNVYGKHTGLKHAVIFGGVSQFHQVAALEKGIDMLVATPGRLLDLMNQGHIYLDHIELLVLDEADRMLDMGFIHDLKKIVARCPRERQTLLFSATMPESIRELARQWLHNPADVRVAPVSSTVEVIEQEVVFVPQKQKSSFLAKWLDNTARQRTLVFTRTKHGADKVVRHLEKAGIKAEAIHGNKSQNARVRALEKFKSKHPPVLVATDIAARGLDVDGVSHVVNFDVPHEPETYVHRIGRTGRAGATGKAISLCDSAERSDLRAIERLINRRIESAKLEFEFTAATPDPNDTAIVRGTRGGGERKHGHQNGQRQGNHGHDGQRPEARAGGGGKFKKFRKGPKRFAPGSGNAERGQKSDRAPQGYTGHAGLEKRGAQRHAQQNGSGNSNGGNSQGQRPAKKKFFASKRRKPSGAGPRL
jgi:ATP-dependent RNA helicase RhlE